MKKLLSLILAVLMLAMGTIAFAEGLTREATLEWAVTAADPVVAVNMEWGSLAFKYKGTTTYDAGSMEEKLSETAIVFNGDATEAEITVGNQSNVDITVQCQVTIQNHVAGKVTSSVRYVADKGNGSDTAYLAKPEVNAGTQVIDSAKFYVSFKLADNVTLTKEEVNQNNNKFATVTFNVAQKT